MSAIYDNWERLVAAVLRREQFRELCRCPSLSSVASSDDLGSSSSRSFSSPVPDGPASAPKDWCSGLSEKSFADSGADSSNWYAAAAGTVKGWLLKNGDSEVQRPIPRAAEAEQVAAGWPSWLSAVASEAIRGLVPRRADSFNKLDKIGQGTHSNVYKARDIFTGKIVALKKVRFDYRDSASVRLMAREIHILRRLDHPNIIKLEGLMISRMQFSLYLVLEYMEHDLAGLVSRPDVKFTEAQIKCYMQQFLRGLDHCHRHGIVHRDIKCSDLLVDDNGILKLADFGLATLNDPHRSHPLTTIRPLHSRVMTLWYRAPELLLGGAYHSTAVDLWCAGCVLAELYIGKPIMTGETEVEQLNKVYELCGSPSKEFWKKYKLPQTTNFRAQQPYKRRLAEKFDELPAVALALIEILVSIDPDDNGSAASALSTEFFTTSPHPCDPSDMPKFPPSEISNSKARERDAMRRRKIIPAGLRYSSVRAIAAPETNAELIASIDNNKNLCSGPLMSPSGEGFVTDVDGS